MVTFLDSRFKTLFWPKIFQKSDPPLFAGTTSRIIVIKHERAVAMLGMYCAKQTAAEYATEEEATAAARRSAGSIEAAWMYLSGS